MADPAPLRVTMSTIAYWPSVGGSQLYVQRIAEALCARGHDVEVLTGEAVENVPDYWDYQAKGKYFLTKKQT